VPDNLLKFHASKLHQPVCLARGAATAEGRSALDCVVQVQHAVAPDHLVGIVEEDRAGGLTGIPAMSSGQLVRLPW
jgi:hypothetical protein